MEHKNEQMALFLSRRNEVEAFNLKTFLRKLISRWRWFVPVMAFGLAIAIIYNRFSPPTYAVTGSLFVQERTEENISLNNLFDNLQLRHDVKIPNHLGILASFKMNRQVIENLGWHVAWYRDGKIRNSRLAEQPFRVETGPADKNLPDVPLHVERTGPQKYVIYTDSKPLVVGKQIEIRFREEGEFGKKFKNQYFSFILQDEGIQEKGKYFFIFQDQDKLALDYISRLELTRLDKNMDLISIRLSTHDPQKDMAYVNELEDTYVRYSVERKNQASEKSLRFIERQLATVADTLGKDNDMYRYLLEKRAEAEITRASNVSDVEIIDRAAESTFVEAGPRKMINLLMGLFFGFAVPFLVFVLKDFFNETIQRPEEAERLTPLPVAGTIYHNPYPAVMPVVQYPHSRIAESFRQLRTKLEVLSEKGNVQVLGIQSMVQQEGKSFVALNLACIFAMNKKKVILAEADLRKPALRHWLNLDTGHGLSTYLAGNDRLEEVVVQTEVPGLHLLVAGPPTDQSSELLSSREFSSLVSELRSCYDVVIFDNAPFSIVTEGALTRRYTDLDLFVVREDFSDRKLLDKINQLALEDSRETVLVYNDLHERKRGSGNQSGEPYFTE